MPEPSKEAVELPEGVKRFVPCVYTEEGKSPRGMLVEGSQGQWIRVSDLPAIRNRWEQEVRERLLKRFAELDAQGNEYDGLSIGAVEEVVESILGEAD